ncbi:MAG: WD40/YVTN/BNR-like repeat-containing protein [Rhodanobacteraceae bacterium]
MPAWLAVAALVLATGVLPVTAHAAQFEPALFSGMHWRNIGPYVAGREVAVAGVPSEPNVFYFGAVDGGVWKTTNAGWTWTPIFDHEPIASIGAIAVAPSNPDIIYVGTGEADPRSEVSHGDGMYKSADGGKTWTHIGLDRSMHIGTIIVDPHDPNRLFVAVLGNIYAATPERGIYRSTNGGKTWQKVLFKNANVGGMDLAFDPRNSQIVYATLWATRRPPWSVYPPSNQPGAGIYKSTDGGTTWRQLTQGLPNVGVGKIGIAVTPSNPDRVYAIVDAKQGGLYRSDDAGATWKRMGHAARIWERAWYFGRVTVDPKHENTLYLMNTSVYKSTDGGASFIAWKGAPSGNDYHELWIDPNDPGRMALSSDMLGTVISVDGGKIWSTWNNQPTAQYYHVYASNRYPFWVGGAVQDTGGHSIASTVPNGRITYRYWRPTCTGGESNQVAADPLSVAELYGTGYGGGPSKCNMLTGTNEDISPLIAYPDMTFRHDWTVPVTFSMANKHAFYFANQFLWQTTDGGNTWKKISPDLSREHPGVPSNLDPATAADTTYDQQALGPRWGVIYTIAPSPLQADTIWVGSDDGLIWVTRDDGGHWSNVTPPGVTAWSKVIMLDASHFNADTAYTAIDRHRLNDFGPHVYRTRDDGKTWQQIDNGLPPDAYVQAVKQDPKRKGLLWAGTSVGVYVSFDAGELWQPLRLNMPVVEVRDFAFKDNSVAIATFGRSLWVLDDLSPLRQLNATIAQSPAYLYKPETALLPIGSSGLGLGDNLAAAADMDPIQIWSGEPRMKGAIIDYYLKASAKGPVTLDILDAQGKVIRQYSSVTQSPQPNPKNLPFPAVWVKPPAALSDGAGMHRFAWDFKAIPPGKPAATGMAAFFGGSGHTVVPGQYTVRLTVDGKNYSQPLTAKLPNPMQPALTGVHFDAAAAHAQLQLFDRIQALQSKVTAAEHAAGQLRKQLAARETKATGTLADSIKSLDKQARAIQGFAATPAPDTSGEGAAQPTYNSLKGLATSLRIQASALQQGGMGPPRQAVITGFDKTRETANATLAAWSKLHTSDVQRLNAQLHAAGLRTLGQ